MILFKEIEEEDLSPTEKEIILRYRAIFSLNLEKPYLQDSKVRDFLMNEFKVSESQAYRDIANVRMILGNIKNAGKEWVRYIINETLKKAIDDAEKLGKLGIKLKIMAADKLAKYNRLDKEDGVNIPWEKIVPQSIEPVSDPTVLGVKPIRNKEEMIRKMVDKYKNEFEIEDVPYEEIGDGTEEGLLQ